MHDGKPCLINVFTEAAGSGPDKVPGGNPEEKDGSTGPGEGHRLPQGISQELLG